MSGISWEVIRKVAPRWEVIPSKCQLQAFVSLPTELTLPQICIAVLVERSYTISYISRNYRNVKVLPAIHRGTVRSSIA